MMGTRIEENLPCTIMTASLSSNVCPRNIFSLALIASAPRNGTIDANSLGLKGVNIEYMAATESDDV